jgi:oligopeptidase A
MRRCFDPNGPTPVRSGFVFRGLLVVAVLGLCVACDPVDRRPGVWLTGELAPKPQNWAFTDSHQEVFVETATWYGIPHSVTTVVAVADGRLYVPSIYEQPSEFPGTKFWNGNIARNPDVRLKIGDSVYELRAEQVTDEDEFQRGFEALADKYGFWKQGLLDPDARPEFVIIRMGSREDQPEENHVSETTELNDSRTSLNALEQTASHGPINHLPVWSGVQAAHVEPGIGLLLAEAEATFADIESNHTPSWEGLMEPLERVEHRLGRVVGLVTHLLSVKYDDELQAAYDAVRPEYVTLINRMSQSRAVYQGMLDLRDGDQWSGLNQSRRRILTESIRAMERSGVHLEGEAKARYQEIQERLSKLSNDFSTNLVKEEKGSRIRVSNPARVAGVPAAVLSLALDTAKEDGIQIATEEAGPWHFVVSGMNYVAIIQHAEDRGLREEFYRAFRARGTSEGFDNRPLLAEILELRQEQSALVGFATYAARSIDAKMAPSTESVWQLFDELESAARPAAVDELAMLVAYMREQGAEEAEDPKPWDTTYWLEKLREAMYSYDSERLREYFQMPLVFDGLFSLVAKLYAVDIRRVDPAGVPVWDDNVEFFEVRRQGDVIAAFFVDPYARPGEKRGGAWMNTIVDRSRLLASAGQSSSLPVALFVMNARPPVDGNPALMSLGEVRTLFHEFGHATQHMFTAIEEGGASGMNLVEWDAVELASQFNEYWMEHKPFLRNLTSHFETGEPLDEETLDHIIDSRNFMVANGTLRQLLFGKTDMTLHERYGLPGANDGATPFEIEREIARATIITPMLEDESMLPAFGHTFSGGYAAGYYSYKWAEVLAADAFAAFKEVGLDNDEAVRVVAERFRDTVLGLGGSLPAEEVYRRFRGRDATPEALLVDQGLRAPGPAG